jgi:hypothetical protein
LTELLTSDARDARRATTEGGVMYRSLTASRIPLGSDRCLVTSPLNRKGVVVSGESVRLLEGCNVFDTLDGHAERVANRLRSGRELVPAVRRLLDQLVDAGALVREADVISACRTITSSSSPADRIAAFGVPTRNRPQTVIRALDSYLECCSELGRSIDLTVVDMSMPPHANAVREGLRRLAATRHVSIRYAGRMEIEQFASMLDSRCGVDRATTDFLFALDGEFPVSTGATRNALLLDTIGQRAVSVDDDTLAVMFEPPVVRSGLALSSAPDPSHFWFFDRRDTVLARPRVQGDPIAIHGGWLGRDLAACVTRETGRVDVDELGPGLLHHVMTGEARVTLTFMGIAGDCAMASPAYLASLRGQSRARLTSAPGTYARALVSRELIRCVHAPTLTDSPFCMTLNVGYDNAQPLPPFLPVCRNQDMLFGTLLRIVSPASCFAHLPMALLHDPPLSPSVPGEWRMRLGAGVCDLIGTLVADVAPSVGDAVTRTRLIGDLLGALGRLPRGEFEEIVGRVWSRRLAHALVRLEPTLQEEGPEAWKADVRQQVEQLHAAITSAAPVIPIDLPGTGSAEEKGRAFQRLVGRFGDLLHHWPAIRDAAQSAFVCDRRVSRRLEV